MCAAAEESTAPELPYEPHGQRRREGRKEEEEEEEKEECGIEEVG